MKNTLLLIIAAFMLVACGSNNEEVLGVTHAFTGALKDSVTKASHYYPGFIDLELLRVPDSVVIDENPVAGNGDTAIVNATCYLKVGDEYEPVKLEFVVAKNEENKFQICDSKGLVLASLTSAERQLAIKTGMYKEDINDVEMNKRISVLPEIDQQIERKLHKNYGAWGSLVKTGNSTYSKILVKNKSDQPIDHLKLHIEVTAIVGGNSTTQTSTIEVTDIPAKGTKTVDGPSENDPNTEFTAINIVSSINNASKSKLLDDYTFTGKEFDEYVKDHPIE